MDRPKRIIWINEKTDGGGAGKLYASGKRLLEADGAMVAPFFGRFQSHEVEAVYHPFQPPRLEDNNYIGFARRTLNPAAVCERLDALAGHFKPDLLIIQNCQKFIPPLVIPHAARWGIPLVLLLNDYAPYCAKFYAWRDEHICHDCINGNFAQAVLHRCSNRPGVSGLLQTVSRAVSLSRAWDRDAYMSAGSYLTAGRRFADRLAGAGFDRRRIVDAIFPHFITGTADRTSAVDDRTFVYFGSELPIKGQQTLLDASRLLPRDVTIKLFTLKPSEALTEAVARLQAFDGARIEIISDMSWDTGVRQQVARCAAVIVPSLWESPHELVVYESMALGRPVVVTDISSNAELIQDGINGHIYAAGLAEGLAAAIKRFYRGPAYTLKLGNAAATYYDETLHPRHWLEHFYEAAELARASRSLS